MNTKIKKLTCLSLFCALSYLCMFVFRIKISFLTFEMKDSITVISAFLFGPLSGLAVSFVVAFLEFFTVSDTGIYGMIMNFLSSATFALSAGLVYAKFKSKRGAVIGLCVGVLAVTAVMILANLLITPFYMGVPRGEVVKLIPSLLLPFNLTKSIINATIALLIYKPLVTALRKARIAVESTSVSKKPNGKYNKIITVIGILVLIACLVFFFVYMNGKFELVRK